ncbi:MAG: endonuclease/exonuclease/phosphatase family protein [Kiritimatiellae bacterium]|nr:endonuclease/exonuclease/phosphatase family protein [Kiritimatiellia bacterium]
MTGGLAAMLAAVVVGTWNGNWFPSGRAEHRAHPDVEEATSFAAAKMLARGLAEADPSGTNDVILCLHEMRGPRAASNLVARIGRSGLRVVSVSGYRRRDRFDQQQDAIATTLPVAASSWSRWRLAGKETPPRGFAFASVVTGHSVTANVYAVHLKSNYGATTPELRALNRAKRARAAAELVAIERKGAHVIVAGDMNADKWRKEFAEERLFSTFEKAGFANPLAQLPADARGTHPSSRYGDSALDYVFVRGFTARRPTIVPNDGLSDHYALFIVLE